MYGAIYGTKYRAAYGTTCGTIRESTYEATSRFIYGATEYTKLYTELIQIYQWRTGILARTWTGKTSTQSSTGRTRPWRTLRSHSTSTRSSRKMGRDLSKSCQRKEKTCVMKKGRTQRKRNIVRRRTKSTINDETYDLYGKGNRHAMREGDIGLVLHHRAR